MRLAGKIVKHLFLVLISVLMLLPTWWIVTSSLKPEANIFKDVHPLSWRAFFPPKLIVENYKEAFSRYPLFKFFSNSVIVATISTSLGIIINSLAGYSLARFSFTGRRIFLFLILIGMMMPFEVIVIPLYLVMKQLKLVNTFLALILPMIAHEMSVFIFYQFFKEIPVSLEECALLDGASYLKIWLKIVLPLSRPVFVTAALLQFTVTWNAFFWPLVAVNKPELLVYQVGVVYFKTEFWISWGALFAATTVGMLPIILLFLCLQRFYLQSISLTGIKG